ncbi:hypothetical protein HYW83_00635 [Candidatus Peregrinibacteria bacterium]|nr:hypothetical protein [Candidatus Peregrinibacteria bacterium]
MASPAKPAEHQEEDVAKKGGKEKVGHAKPSLLSRGLEAGWSGSKKVVGGITKYTWQLVRGTLGGLWKATGVAAGRAIAAPFRHIAKSARDIGEIGKQIAAEARERHHIGKLAPALKGIMLATAMSIGNVLYLPVSPGVGAASGVIEGAENVGSALVMKYDAHKGSGAAPTASHEPAGNGGHETKHA